MGGPVKALTKISSPFLRFAHAVEVVPGVSFTEQSQAPDIPGISTCAAILQYASLNAQSKPPDIPLLSMRASKQELSASLKATAQAPDDPCVQEPEGAPHDFCLASPVFTGNQVLTRLSSEPLKMPVHFPSSVCILPRRTKIPSSQACSRGDSLA